MTLRKIYFDELCQIIDDMQIGESFSFYEECDSSENNVYDSDNANGAFGVIKTKIFDANVVIINYWGGGKPLIIDVTSGLDEPDYSVRTEDYLKYYFDNHIENNFVFVTPVNK